MQKRRLLTRLKTIHTQLCADLGEKVTHPTGLGSVAVSCANLSNPQTLNLYATASDNPETFADLDATMHRQRRRSVYPAVYLTSAVVANWTVFAFCKINNLRGVNIRRESESHPLRHSGFTTQHKPNYESLNW
jgi:hypothetical protein